jgi:hypothetical protein
MQGYARLPTSSCHDVMQILDDVWISDEIAKNKT